MSMIGSVMLYAELHFGWTPQRASTLTTAWGIVQCATMYILSVVDKHCGSRAKAARERAIAWVGLVAGFAGMLLLTGSFVDWLLVPGMSVGAISMLTYTALTSYAGRLVEPSMSGEVQGLIGTTLDLTEVLGPPFFGALMRWSLSPSSSVPVSFPFSFGALFVLVAMVVQSQLPAFDEVPSTSATPLAAGAAVDASSGAAP